MSDGLLASLRDTTYEGWLGEENTLGQSIMKRKYVRGMRRFQIGCTGSAGEIGK